MAACIQPVAPDRLHEIYRHTRESWGDTYAARYSQGFEAFSEIDSQREVMKYSWSYFAEALIL